MSAACFTCRTAVDASNSYSAPQPGAPWALLCDECFAEAKRVAKLATVGVPLSKLYKLALFGPGATVPGSSATFANVLLRAEHILSPDGSANATFVERAQLRTELAALRVNIEQRQTMLAEIHDKLKAALD